MATVGSTVVASAMAGGLDPFAASLVRFGVASPILLVICFLRGERLPRLTLREWGVIAFQSAAGSLGYTLALIWGLRYASPADASVLTGLMPIAAAAIAVLALGERPGAALWGAIALASAGSILVAFGKSGAAGEWRLLGLALVLAAVIGEACFALLNKAVATPVAPVVVATLMAVISLGLTAIPGAAAFWRAPEMLGDFRGLGAMAYYGVVPTVCGFWLWYTGAALTRGAQAAAFMAVAPLSAMLLSVLVLGETMRGVHIAGMALVLGAIALASLGDRES